MIVELPCGCAAKPIKKPYQVKMHLLSGDAIYFDDPRCADHEDGSGIWGVMRYQDGVVTTVLWNRVNGEQKEVEFSFDQALLQLEAYRKDGFDFSKTETTIQRINGRIYLICEA